MKALAGDRRDRLRAMLADLKTPGALEAVDGILAQAGSGAVTASEAIEELLSAQIVLRNNRRLQTAMRSSRLPAVKTLQQLDFSFQPSIKREQIESLHELGFPKRAENVILLGPPGVGKTHLAIRLAIAAAESGRRVYYGTLAALIESLTEAKAAGNLSRRLRVLTHPALLVVDEIGYLPVSQDEHRRRALVTCVDQLEEEDGGAADSVRGSGGVAGSGRWAGSVRPGSDVGSGACTASAGCCKHSNETASGDDAPPDRRRPLQYPTRADPARNGRRRHARQKTDCASKPRSARASLTRLRAGQSRTSPKRTKTRETGRFLADTS